MQALKDHTSPETAYPVNDYPYGRKLRCRIRYWLESDPKRGFRFCSQTENPKTMRWNAPKKSTYALLAGAMFLDDQGHVHCDTLNEYSSPADFQRFVRNFPDAITPTMPAWVAAKVRFCAQILDGTVYFTINGQRQTRTDEQRTRDLREHEEWSDVATLLREAGKPCP